MNINDFLGLFFFFFLGSLFVQLFVDLFFQKMTMQRSSGIYLKREGNRSKHTLKNIKKHNNKYTIANTQQQFHDKNKYTTTISQQQFHNKNKFITTIAQQQIHKNKCTKINSQQQIHNNKKHDRRSNCNTKYLS